jgi:hypothetical protein
VLERVPGGWPGHGVTCYGSVNEYNCFCDLPIPHERPESGITSLYQAGFVHRDLRNTVTGTDVMVRKDDKSYYTVCIYLKCFATRSSRT